MLFGAISLLAYDLVFSEHFQARLFVTNSNQLSNTFLIFGLTRRQLTAAWSTSDFSTTDTDGASTNELNFSCS